MNKDILKNILKPSDNEDISIKFIDKNNDDINVDINKDTPLAKKYKVLIDFKDKIRIIDGIIEVYTKEIMDSVIKKENIGKIYKFLGETNEKYVNGALYLIEEE